MFGDCANQLASDGCLHQPVAHCLMRVIGYLYPAELPSKPDICTVQMIVNNLWQLAPPEPPTPQEEAEEARRQQALKVRLPCASSCLRVCWNALYLLLWFALEQPCLYRGLSGRHT